jgi:predicted RNase H-like nuclease (RuvC/YqgF family)
MEDMERRLLQRCKGLEEKLEQRDGVIARLSEEIQQLEAKFEKLGAEKKGLEHGLEEMLVIGKRLRDGKGKQPEIGDSAQSSPLRSLGSYDYFSADS